MASKLFFVLLLSSFLILSHCIPAPQFRKGRKWHPKKAPVDAMTVTTSTYSTAYFTQIVDHFNFAASPNSNTWQQRYLINDTFWTPGYGPILFYCGNEGDITGFWENSGFVTDTLAIEFNGLVLFAEHRYFGESMPFGNASFENVNLQYLTTEQALADFITFLHTFKTQIINCPQCPVIAFGGSYGGMLAAWIRMKFPNIVDGALAASAPILLFRDITPLESFYEICSNDFNNTQTTQCADVIQEGFSRLTAYSNNETAYLYLNQLLTLCSPLNSSSDIMNYLENWLGGAYVSMCMADYPYEANFLSPMPGFPVNYGCWAFTGLSVNSSDEDIFNAMIKAANIYYDYLNQTTCVDLTNGNPVDQNSSVLDDDGWNILSCNEMVLPTASDGIQDMFYPQPWNDTEYAEQCNQTYNQLPREFWVPNFYGGWDIQIDFSSYSNIFFSNGQLDPWSSGGVLQNISDSLIAYYIPESAHHLDLRLPNAADPEGLIFARNMEKYYIYQWIQQKYLKNELATFRKRENIAFEL